MPPMAGTWQLKTWTKGTGAAVEPVGSSDSFPVEARPGGLTPMPPKRVRAPLRHRGTRAGQHRTTAEARRRHALRHMDEETVAELEVPERTLADRG
jgi:hypothetical protein